MEGCIFGSARQGTCTQQFFKKKVDPCLHLKSRKDFSLAKILRSHSGFATVADGFDRTSFHGFLAKHLLLRGGRLLKHIGVAAVVAAPEISGCGFPAQVAINTLRFEDLKTLMAAMVEATQRNEVGALTYEWAISDD